MPQEYFVYMIASNSRTLYVGMTGNLPLRALQHKQHIAQGFTDDYNCTRLVWYERHRYVNNAIARETQIKKWRREKKIFLIERSNPTWENLAEGLGEPVQFYDAADSQKQVSPLRSASVEMTNLSGDPVQSCDQAASEKQVSPLRFAPVEMTNLSGDPVRSCDAAASQKQVSPLRFASVEMTKLGGDPVQFCDVATSQKQVSPVRFASVEMTNLSAVEITGRQPPIDETTGPTPGTFEIETPVLP